MDSDIFQYKVFVYPEVLEYFFETIYPHYKNEFELYTIDCDFITNENYLKKDINHLIKKCHHIKHI